MTRCGAIIFLSFAIISTTYADSLDVREIGHYEISSVSADLCVSGDYAYVSFFDYPLRIIDVSDKTSPVEVGSCAATLYYNPNGISISGNYVYLAYGYDADSTGMSIIDVTSKTTPLEINYSATENRAHDVYVSGNYAYVPQCLGLQIYDVSTPPSPATKGFCDIFLSYHPQAVFASGNYAYVAGTKQFEVIDVSDPNKPFITGTCSLDSSYAWDVYISGSYAYVAADFSGLRIIDVSDPENPHQVGVFDTPGRTTAVSVSENYAYVADDFGGLRVIDVSIPSSPIEVGFYETPNIAEDVYADHPYVFVTCHSAGLRIYEYEHFTNIDEKPQPALTTSLEIRASANRLEYRIQENATLSVYSATGSLVMQKALKTSGSLEVDRFPSGIYFARLSSGGITRETKLVVLH